MNNKKYALVLMIMLSFFSFSCAGSRNSLSQQGIIPERSVMPLQDIQAVDEYLLGPGDVIEVIYHIKPVPSKEEYRLAIGDTIKVEFFYQPEANREVSIRPDGKITLPLKGDVEAVNHTPEELGERLTDLYRDDFKDPVVTVTPILYNQALNQLKEAITTASDGQSKRLLIRPDGYISFPLLDDLKISGLTLPQLQARVLKEYNSVINNLTVSLNLAIIKSNLVYVMGEVRTQGYFVMEAPTTVIQILARAGGALDSARKDSIVVVRRTREGRPEGRIVNMEKILEENNIGQDILLKQYDVVYVPKSRIARADLFVHQYINQLIPQLFRTNFSFGYDLHREDPE